MKKIIQNCLLAAALAAPASAGAEAVIFANPINGAAPYLSNPYTTGQVVGNHLSASGISRGAGIAGEAGPNSYNASGWGSPSMNPNDYFEFTLSPDAGYDMDFTYFSYNSQASAAGPLNFSVRSSLDGFTTDLGPGAPTSATIDLTGPGFQNISTPITFRIYAWGAPLESGTFSINDFTFSALTPLPISLHSFTLSKENKAVHLQWNFAGSYSGESVTLQRSSDGRTFETISSEGSLGFAPGAKHTYTDAAPRYGINYYRLAITASSGHTTYSNVLSAIIGGDYRTTFYPIPAHDELQIDWNKTDGPLEIAIYNSTGLQVLNRKFSGSAHAAVGTATLPAGSYIVHLVQGTMHSVKPLTIVH